MKANEVEHGSPSSASDSTIRKRGRPRKSGHAESSEAQRSYWVGEVFFDQGWAWGTELVEVEPIDSRRCWQVYPLCLGKEDEIVSILRGYKQIPDDMHPRRRALLASILEANEYGGVEVTPGATHLQRSGYAQAAGHRQKDARRLKAREGLSLLKAHYKVKGLSRR